MFLYPALTFAQDTDSTVAAIADSTAIFEDYFGEDDLPDQRGEADSDTVNARGFDETRLNELKRDPNLHYEQAPTVAESLWDRFWNWVAQFFDSLIENAVTTDWGRFFSYLAGLAVFIVVIMLILKIDAFKVFYSGQGATPVQYSVFDENIHELDFEKEIDAALLANDYRRGVRLLFLYALKLLADKNHILWEQGKTNHDYVAEVKEETLRSWLNQLSYYFDYAWYGNFTVSRDLFDKVNEIFSNRRGGIQ